MRRVEILTHVLTGLTQFAHAAKIENATHGCMGRRPARIWMHQSPPRRSR
jgi:hypothetical protein